MLGSVEVVGYDGGQPGVKLSFARYIAEGPKCGKFPDDLAQNSDNVQFENFGCAAQHNMAAMIANPHDLVIPRDQTDWSEGDRKDFIYRAYYSGAETAADTKAVQQSGNVSDVAKK